MKTSILSVLLFFASNGLYADSVQSLDLLKSRIEAHLLNELATYAEGKIQVSAENLDPRLNLKSCTSNALQVFNPYQTAPLNTSTMGIKCMEENNHWTLYVPVRITVLKTVLVAKRALVKGSTLTSDDIYPLEMDAQKLKQGYFTESNELDGLVCKKNITPDSPLNPNNIELAKMVHRGDHVTIVAVHNNLSISMEGIALNEGALGEAVKVKNRTSKRIIEAKVSGDKKVTVIL